MNRLTHDPILKHVINNIKKLDKYNYLNPNKIETNFDKVIKKHIEYISFVSTYIKNNTNLVKVGDFHQSKYTIKTIHNEDNLYFKPRGVNNILYIKEIFKILNLKNKYIDSIIQTDKINNFYISKELPNNKHIIDYDIFSYSLGRLLPIINELRMYDLHSDNFIVNQSDISISDYDCITYPTSQNLPRYSILNSLIFESKNNKIPLIKSDDTKKLNIDLLLNGVDATYQHIEDNKNCLYDLYDFYKKRISNRIILKPTKFYLECIARSFHPKLIKSTYERRNFIEQCLSGNSNISRAIIKSEITDLMCLDIPYFTLSGFNLYDSRNKLINSGLFTLEKQKYGNKSILFNELSKLLNIPL